MSRRSVMSGVGSAGLLSLVGMPTAAEREGAIDELETDPHTRDTYRAVVDALIPRTPDLADELGEEHEPGGLEIELERFLIWSFNNSEEVHANGGTDVEAMELDLDEDDLSELVDGVLADLTAASRTILDALGLADAEAAFGALEGITVDVTDGGADAAATVTCVVEAESDPVRNSSENYPYAPVFAAVFDLVALEFVARRQKEDDVSAVDSRFPAGGAFARLSRKDRLRCLEWILDGGVIDALDEELSELLAVPGSLKYAVTALHAATALGYYSEWSGYGETGTGPPSERSLETPVDEVQSRRQTGYPGMEPGYADHRGFELNEFREDEYR